MHETIITRDTTITLTKSEFRSRYENYTDRWSRSSCKGPIPTAVLDSVSTVQADHESIRLLNVGCGRMCIDREIAKRWPGVSITAIDYVMDTILQKYPELIRLAEQLRIETCCVDLMDYVSSQPYEIILDLGLFHHLLPAQWPQYIKQVDELLSANGILLLRMFHVSDITWPYQYSGGYIRSGYYCHYHTLESVGMIYGDGYRLRKLAVDERKDHTEWLVLLQKAS